MEKIQIIPLILTIFCCIFLIIACICIFIQSIINIKYNSNNKTILAEKLVYEQFSFDVFSNINNKILYQFETVSIDEDCPEDKEIIKIPIKIDSFYDCEGVFNDEIDKEVCQDKISTSSTCCKQECCKENVYIKQKICRDKNEDYNEQNDPRKDICQYFNIYNGKIHLLNNRKICAKRYENNYEYLLSLYENNDCTGQYCGFFDSMGHCICDSELKNTSALDIDDINFNLQLNSFIVKNLFSEINPNYFEYEMLLEESILNNKIKISEKEQNRVNEYKVINIKNIYNAFFKKIENINKDGNNNYINQKNLYLNNLIGSSNEKVLTDFQNNQYIRNKNINWYTRNYIGFENIKELEKFKKYFDENDPTNNPLYKINTILYPNIESIIITFIFFLSFIFIICTQIILIIKNREIINQEFIVFNSYRQISSLVLLIIYLFLFLFKYVYYYRRIETINMEKYYQIVLEKYNERRKQKYLLIAIIFLIINFLFEIANYILSFCIDKKEEGNPPSKITIICTLRNSVNNDEYKFKFYLNRTFYEEKKRFKKKFFKNYDIYRCQVNDDRIIDDNEIISSLGLIENSIIDVECEERE